MDLWISFLGTSWLFSRACGMKGYYWPGVTVLKMCVRGWFHSSTSHFSTFSLPFAIPTNIVNISIYRPIDLQATLSSRACCLGFSPIQAYRSLLFNFELFLYISWAPTYFLLHPPNDQFVRRPSFQQLTSSLSFSPLRGVVILLFNQPHSF
jgi:hypothetical protein